MKGERAGKLMTDDNQLQYDTVAREHRKRKGTEEMDAHEPGKNVLNSRVEKKQSIHETCTYKPTTGLELAPFLFSKLKGIENCVELYWSAKA